MACVLCYDVVQEVSLVLADLEDSWRTVLTETVQLCTVSECVLWMRLNEVYLASLNSSCCFMLQADEVKSHSCEDYRKSVYLDNWVLRISLWFSQLLVYVLLEVTLNGFHWRWWLPCKARLFLFYFKNQIGSKLCFQAESLLAWLSQGTVCLAAASCSKLHSWHAWDCCHCRAKHGSCSSF